MRKRLKDSLWLQLIAFTALIMFFLLAAYAVTDSYSGKILRDRTIDLNDKILLQVEGKMEDFHDTLNHGLCAHNIRLFYYGPGGKSHGLRGSVRDIFQHGFTGK